MPIFLQLIADDENNKDRYNMNVFSMSLAKGQTDLEIGLAKLIWQIKEPRVPVGSG